jgi:succinate dehydrogenase/fumarate reductase-like Fe-S protein
MAINGMSRVACMKQFSRDLFRAATLSPEPPIQINPLAECKADRATSIASQRF